MNKLPIAFFFLSLAPVFGAGPTGHWLATQTFPDGQTRETSLWLKADGDTLTGYMSSSNQDAAPVSNGKITGSEISFSVVRDNFGEERKTDYSGTLTNDTLTLHMPGFGGRRVREMPFKQVSTDPPGPLPANGLAKTPPMGWNSWNKFARRVSDQVVRETADAIVKNGMKDAGYIYINIDDAWQGSRDSQGNIRPNEKFPDMKALADYVHRKGLKIGIYSSPGPKTCANYEGSFQHEEQDAKTFAAWGIDYIKYDWCSASQVYDYHSMPAVYAKMGRALLDSGRLIVYSLCQYGVLKSEIWGAKVGGNSWRTTGDIRDSWESMSHIGFDQQLALAPYAGPGHWNDPDMLEIGNGGMTTTEYRTHMSLWSLLAAPLLAGNDLNSASPDIMSILLNKEVIAIDQDPLGKQATRVSKEGDLEVWARPLDGGAYAVGLFNRGASSAKVTARWSDVGLHGSARVRDLWKHEDLGASAEAFSSDVPSHGVTLVRVNPAR
jgi:alpha-galactosidase